MQLEREREERQVLSRDERAVTEELTRLLDEERGKKDAIKEETRELQRILEAQKRDMETELEAARAKLKASEAKNADYAKQ